MTWVKIDANGGRLYIVKKVRFVNNFKINQVQIKLMVKGDKSNDQKQKPKKYCRVPGCRVEYLNKQ